MRAGVPGSCRIGATGIFPFAFHGQSVKTVRQATEPLCVLPCRKLRHSDSWLPRVFTVGERGGGIVEIRRRGNGIGLVLGCHESELCRFNRLKKITGRHIDFIFRPRHLVTADPKRFDENGKGWPLVSSAVGFIRRTSHLKLSTGHRHHPKRDICSGNLFCVGNHPAPSHLDRRLAARGSLGAGDETGRGMGGSSSFASR